MAAHPGLGIAASPEVPDKVGENFTSIKWQILLNPVGRAGNTSSRKGLCMVSYSSRGWKRV